MSNSNSNPNQEPQPQSQQDQAPGYYASTKQWYNKQYESWMPWVEDKVLGWFGQNKTSYVAKGELDKTKITGDKNVDAIQDGINEGVTGQFKKGGLLEGVGDLTSKEVMNRGERKGKNDKGGYGL
ncbi:hypothetical protein G647_02190 [Cladophialophora carrionii CBS 160.54]|uniref:Uncharacterized protein n=1 Tax=Cladophialophora carrionii CBS 160.54 TaxID=1279043 RepID=V9DHK6_9EURO|nr:uncharacterized protein G647_02190 [Cladophialophora carrionii CBS 160.54]ETI25417.1 hypothetical protein G647_02190 [Cladophialophora carrionii CBS 160.54]